MSLCLGGTLLAVVGGGVGTGMGGRVREDIFGMEGEGKRGEAYTEMM